jgi:hypothetical protein
MRIMAMAGANGKRRLHDFSHESSAGPRQL